MNHCETMPTARSDLPATEPPSAGPVAIGGVGGSGTSVVARLIEALGVFMGFDLNQSYDNLAATLLLRDPRLLGRADETVAERFAVLKRSMTANGPLTPNEQALLDALPRSQNPERKRWTEERITRLSTAAQSLDQHTTWGWKEPNTHLILDRLYEAEPGLRYIHVLRHGLDVAASTNQRQRARWSQRILKAPFIDTPRQALQYWCACLQRVHQIASNSGPAIHVLNFDALCESPSSSIQALADFLGLTIGEEKVEQLTTMVRTPASIGRYRFLAPSDFDAEDLAQVRDAGFSVDPTWLAEGSRQLDHNNAAMHYVTGNLFANGQRWPEAVASMKKAVTLAPQKPRFRRALTELHLRNGDFESAEREFRSAVELDKSRERLTPASYLQIARSLADQNEFDAATYLAKLAAQAFGSSGPHPVVHPHDGQEQHLDPTFLVLGAQRCGTTSLFRLLQQHPQIDAPAKKELHFFDNRFHKGLSWYQKQFPEPCGSEVISGEATPYYLFHPLAPARVRAHYPTIKLLVVLRNPADRAYSHYKWAVSKENEPLSFNEALNAEEARVATARLSLLTGQPSFSHQKHTYLSRGRYLEQLHRWFELFPRDQFLILRSEDLFADPQPVLDHVWDFLELAPFTPPALERQKSSEKGAMDPAQRQQLIEYYRDYNLALESFLDRTFSWH